MPIALTPRLHRRPVLDLQPAAPRPAHRDCQACGGVAIGSWRGDTFVCDRAGHVTEPISTGPIRTYA